MTNKENLKAAAELIKKATNILLIPHAKMDCDGMSSAIALYLLLKKIGKNPTAVCSDPVPDAFSFLPSTQVFSQSITKPSPENDFVVTVDISESGFKGLEYKVEDGKVNIVLSSASRPLVSEDFSFLSANTKPDLIITLDSGDIPQLGSLYTDNIDLFNEIPVLNIDHHISNTHFGTMNLVEMKNASTTEIIYDLLPYLHEKGRSLLDDDIATLLLAGMITDTGSFQHSNTTPKALDTAAELIEIGARQQEIIKHIFKTKSLATLRLWGRVLTKLQNDPIHRMVWSSVCAEDLHESLAHSDDTEGLIDELLSTTPGTEMVLLVKEREDGVISTSVRTSSSLVDSVAFTKKFGGGGHRQAAGFKIRERGGKSFDEIVSDIIFEAKNFQASRLGITLPARNISQVVQESNPIIEDIPLVFEQKKTQDSVVYDFPVERVESHQVEQNIVSDWENQSIISKEENDTVSEKFEEIDPKPVSLEKEIESNREQSLVQEHDIFVEDNKKDQFLDEENQENIELLDQREGRNTPEFVESVQETQPEFLSPIIEKSHDTFLDTLSIEEDNIAPTHSSISLENNNENLGDIFANTPDEEGTNQDNIETPFLSSDEEIESIFNDTEHALEEEKEEQKNNGVISTFGDILEMDRSEKEAEEKQDINTVTTPEINAVNAFVEESENPDSPFSATAIIAEHPELEDSKDEFALFLSQAKEKKEDIEHLDLFVEDDNEVAEMGSSIFQSLLGKPKKQLPLEEQENTHGDTREKENEEKEHDVFPQYIPPEGIPSFPSQPKPPVNNFPPQQ